jgi:hypothetical protein
MLKLTDNIKAYIGIEDGEYIVQEVDIADGDQILYNQPDVPRNITIVVTDGDTSISAGLVTVTGTGVKDEIVSEVLDLANDLTLVGTEMFKTITSVNVSNLVGAGAGDTIKVGIGSVIQLTVGKTTLENMIVLDDLGDVGAFGVSGTTVNVATLKQNIAAGVYEFNCSLANGLRIIMSGDSPLTVTYSQ